MATFKTGQILYETETMSTLRVKRDLTITSDTTLYLRATINTADWQWQDGTTSKDVTIDAGKKEYTFDLEYTGTFPTASTKYSVAVDFAYYTDSGYTNLLRTDSHTFEIHFYHHSDFSTYVYDHIGFDGSLSSDNGHLTATATYETYVTAYVEGTGAYERSVGSYENILKVEGIPANKFLIFAFKCDDPDQDEGIFINNARQVWNVSLNVYKGVFYTTGDTTLKIRVYGSSTSPKTCGIDGLYVFNEIP